MMLPKVSVILTSYNRPKLLKEAVDSVLLQSLKDWELIVVDDDSSAPEVQSYLHALETTKARIPIIRRKLSLGEDREATCRYCGSINIGLEIAGGEYITYLTDDDYYMQSRLEIMSRFLDANIEAHVVYGRQQVLAMSPNGWKSVGIRMTVGKTRDVICKVDHNSFMHRRTCLNILAKPYWPENPELWHDGDTGFFAKLIQHWNFWPIEMVLDVHRVHPNQVQTRINNKLSPVYTEEL